MQLRINHNSYYIANIITDATTHPIYQGNFMLNSIKEYNFL